MRTQDFFASHPIFTRDEFTAFLDADRSRSVKTRDSLLAYHTDRGHILRIRRGLYAVVQPGPVSAVSQISPYLIAAKMADDAVLAYHTALEFYGNAYSVSEHFRYLTRRMPRPVIFSSYHFYGVRFPKKLREKGQEGFGVRTVRTDGISVRVTSPERTLVDLLDRPKFGGSWEEIWRSLELTGFFDLEQVVEYALILGNATTVAKTGFFLEQHRDSLMVEDSHLDALRKHRPRKVHYLKRDSRKRGRFAGNWNLIVPEELAEQSWNDIL